MITSEKSDWFHVVIGEEVLDFNEGIKFVSSPQCGAISSFIGTIRDTDIRNNSSCLCQIKGIFYEAYKPMLLKQVRTIIETTMCSDNMLRQYGLLDKNYRVFISIKTGLVLVGQPSIVICISSTGRDLSHRAAMDILRQIKALAAIWKKVIYADGTEEWAGVEKSEAGWLAHHEPK